MAAPDRKPGIGGSESSSETLTPATVNDLRDRYLQARGLEGARQVHIGNSDGSFVDFTTTPEGDAWSLVVRTPGTQFSRFDLGILPKQGPYAKTIQPTVEGSVLGTAAAFGFKNFLDVEYPQKIEESSGGYASNTNPNMSPDDADGLISARSGLRTLIDRIANTEPTVEPPQSSVK